MAASRYAVVAVFLLAACSAPPDPGSPYPALTVTGSVLDVRGAAVDGARVLIWNEFDTASATTAADGTFSLVLDGSDSASPYRVTDARYRPREGTLTVTDASHTAGAIAVVSKDEITFSTSSGDLYMLKAGVAGSLLRLTDGAGAGTADVEVTPARSTDGLTVRWANVTQGTVEEAAWNGSGARVVWTIDSAHTLMGMAWAARGTLVTRSRTSDGAVDVVIAEDPPGANFAYAWPGQAADFSPPAFGHLGPYAINGNMAAFAGPDGIDIAFPYFGNSFLVPEQIPGTAGGDLCPRWSPRRADGTLDLAFQRGYALYTSRVSASGSTNVWSAITTPRFGTAPAVNINKLAWAPETEGEADRLVLAIHPFSSGSTTYGPGDLVVVSWDHLALGAATSPQLVYDASDAANPGRVIDVAWR